MDRCLSTTTICVTLLVFLLSRAAAEGFVGAALPSGLAVKASAFNASRRLLQLHISWVLSKEGPKASGYNIHVWPLNETNVNCESEPYYGFLQDPSAESWVVPQRPLAEVVQDVNSLSVVPECSYRVRLEANPHDGKTFLETEYTVPECVDGVCSCSYPQLSPRPEMHIHNTSLQTFNISWSLPQPYLLNVTSFLIRVGPEVGGGGDAAVYKWTLSLEVPVVPGQGVYSQEFQAEGSGRHMASLTTFYASYCPGNETHRIFTVEDDKNKNQEALIEIFWTTVLPVGVFALVFCLLAIIFGQRCFFWFERKRTNTQIVGQAFFYKAISMKSEKVFRRSDSLQERNVLYVEKEIEEAKARGQVDGYEISYCRLSLQREIGRGAFGHVYLASAQAIRGIPGSRLVAVKKLRADVGQEEKEEFLEEIWMHKKVGHHPNIVSLLACCTLSTEICMVMEFVPCGDLLHYLRTLRHQLDKRKLSITSMSDGMYSGSSTVMTSLNSQNFSSAQQEDNFELDYVLDHRELHNFALQVAKGMAHLESKRITHRDLAARNILIDRNKVLKISDFGLSRRGVYVNTRRCKVPLRWLSIEAMRDFLYSSKSDVWAFAIVLWEIGTLGGFPYPTVADQDLLNYLKSGNRLEKPNIVSQNLYSVMQCCWAERPEDRFSFADLVSYLEPDPARHVYVNFDSIPPSPLPPTSPNGIFLRNSTCFFK